MLEEGQEVLQSELATAQSDNVTAHSQTNTYRMAAEQVGSVSFPFPRVMFI